MNSAWNYAWKFKVQRVDPLTPQHETIFFTASKLFDLAEDHKILEELSDWIDQLSNDCNETVNNEPKVVLRLSQLAKGCSETSQGHPQCLS